MPTPPLTEEVMAETLAAFERHGTVKAAAEALSIPRSTFRNRLARAQLDPAIADSMQAVGTNMVPALAWAKTKSKDGTSYSVLLKPQGSEEGALDAIRAAFEGLDAAPPVSPPRHADADLLTLYPLADVHIGMMAWGRETGEDYSTALACARVRDWVGQCVASAPPAETAVILGVGDLLHADDQRNVTPQSKHQLDVDTRYFKTVDVTISALAACVDLALQKHKRVILRILPGNHDTHSHLAVLFALAERYRENKRVEVQKLPGEFWAYEWGKVMLAAHHGDKAKAQQMVLYLADEYPELWGRTRHRFLFTGHLHHMKAQDIGGVQWEQLRAVTARDAYAASHAYSARAQMQAITYHKDRGEVSRVKVAA